jgi:hypothetical protein
MPRTAPPSRFLRALAVTLPLGFETPESGGTPPRASLPAEIQADAESLGAIGAVYRSTNGGEVCAAVALRAGSAGPMLARLESRPARGPARSAPMPLAELSAAETPNGFGLWMGCAPATESAAGTSVLALLIDPKPASTRRRYVGIRVGVEPDQWHWRAVTPFESDARLVPAALESRRHPLAIADEMSGPKDSARP